MSTAKRLTIAIIAVIVIAGGALWYMMMYKNQPEKTTTSTATNQKASNTSDTSKSIASTIAYDGSSFSLSTSSITSGSTVKIMNSSSKDLDFDSDPHPTHTDNPELNQGNIGPGESKTFTLTTKGTWGFHNHLDPSQHGNITVS